MERSVDGVVRERSGCVVVAGGCNAVAVEPCTDPFIIDINLLAFSAVLLHGVPGCGKTLLAKALCSEIHDGNFTFFNVAASTLISKWRGESEKLMRVLFDAAKFHAPSIIFIDELDSLTSRRTSREHEATKRLKNEFLSLLDGLESTTDADEKGKVFVLGSTNMPWYVRCG